MARPRDPSIDLKVVDACVALMQEEGRGGLSRARIADRAGVSLPAVNRRFADVDAILLAVASTPDSTRYAVEHPPPDSLRSFLVGRLGVLARALERGPVRRSAAEMLAAAAGDPAIDAAFRATIAEIRVDGLAWIQRAKDAGEVGADVEAHLLLDLVTGGAYYRLLWRGETVTEQDVEDVVDLVLAGAARV